ncbi:family 20 glycosylhydrolase [Streptococcus merionis]|uniref:Beta-N-acetylhexosaminidase n=1 Tax=Streptococcus merionis TaxID=400065 RepID=A0A239SWH9_9STRE|nr:family 20 glycosylhydrolase [Streptococcus merionis]SNU89609.1 beta-N-acetylhexosaminidase [Streptococcus merionis]
MHKVKVLLGTVLLFLTLLLTGQPEAQEPIVKLSGGVMVDVARRYYSLNSLKSIIDTVSENKGDFVHLHLTDDQNYGLESQFLNQTASNAIYNQDDQSYTNPNTNRKFLSYGQLAELKSYAGSKGIRLIPEIDTPAHTGGLKALLPYAEPAVTSQFKWVSWDEDRQLDLDAATTQEAVRQLYMELVRELPGLEYIHIGGDEISGGLIQGQSFISHVNQLCDYLAGQGIKTQIWNDSLSRQLLPSLNRNVEIAYWGYLPHRNPDLATASDLSDQDFKLLNYNGYYLAFVPKPSEKLQSDALFAANDILKTWNLSQFHMDTGDSINSLKNVIGAAFSIWSEESAGLTDEEIFSAMGSPIRALLTVINQENIKRNENTTTTTTESMTEATTTITTEPTTQSTTESTTTTTTESTTETTTTVTTESTTKSTTEGTTETTTPIPPMPQPTTSPETSTATHATTTNPSTSKDGNKLSKSKRILPSTGETIGVLSVAGLALFLFVGLTYYRHKKN